MTMILLAAALLGAQAAPAPAPTPAPAATPVEAPKADLVPVAIETSLGRIVVALDRQRAPITTANFLRYVDTKRYDGQTFYRAMKNGPDGGLIQGGLTTDAGKLLPPIAHEPTSRTGLKHVAGSLSMARLTPGSAKADFFILTTDIPGFDAGAPGGDADGFAVFGHVIEGMDVVKAIYAAPTSPTKGKGVMKGEMLDPPVKIIKAVRVK
jgi:peptidyl-prolyl cis-trans isomerase A (cyclophilin A)